MSIKAMIPASVFGGIEDDFLAAVGAIVMLSSLLEDHLLVLYQALTKSSQIEHVRIQTSDLIPNADKLVQVVSWPTGYGDDATNRATLRTFLSDAAQFFPPRTSAPDAPQRVDGDIAFPVRNDYAHNLWVVKDDGKIFGHRADRKGTHASPRIQILADIDTTRSQIQQLVELNERWGNIRWLVLARDHTVNEAQA